MDTGPSIVWFRHDLRLADHGALDAAVRRGRPIIPAFIWAPEEEGDWAPGAASRWWLHQSLGELAGALKARGGGLILRRGNSRDGLLELVRESEAGAVFWNRRYEPVVQERDRLVEQSLQDAGCRAEVFDAGLLTDPWTVRNRSGKPFQVFTAFWKSCLQSMNPIPPIPKPRRLARFAKHLESVPLTSFGLEPRINWTTGLAATWNPGEAGALRAAKKFCAKQLSNYVEERNRPDVIGTSRLSPHLHFGEITARQVWHGLRQANEKAGEREVAWKSSQYVAELGWREFAHHLLCHFPQTPSKPLRQEFENFPWENNPTYLKAWQSGRTGYPMVDAGMRELWATGWMHNRVRMLVASFLVKDLRIPWQEGARWFWDTLVDADLANNTLGWQWTAGCGADAAPFFRIFNPVSQGEKFDPAGDYVRKWVPELARVPADWIHKPWLAPAALLKQSGIELGRTYPRPIVDHASARNRALAAFERLKSS